MRPDGSKCAMACGLSVEPREDQVRAAYQAQPGPLPGSGRVHQFPRADREGFAVQGIPHFDAPEARFALPSGRLAVVSRDGAAARGVEDVLEHQPRGLHPGVEKDRAAGEPGGFDGGLDRANGFAGEPFAPAHAPLSGKSVVERQPSAVEHRRESAVEGDQKGLRNHQARGHPQQRGALAQSFPHQVEFEVFQIPQAAVNQMRVAGTGAAGKMAPLDQADPEAGAGCFRAQREVARDTRAVDPASQNEHVKRRALEARAVRFAAFEGERRCGRPNDGAHAHSVSRAA